MASHENRKTYGLKGAVGISDQIRAFRGASARAPKGLAISEALLGHLNLY